MCLLPLLGPRQGCQSRAGHTLRVRRQLEVPSRSASYDAPPAALREGSAPQLPFPNRGSRVPCGAHSLESLIWPKHPQGTRIPHSKRGLFHQPPVGLPLQVSHSTSRCISLLWSTQMPPST